ncbi:MAG: TlpA family protein disulfide reductase, partial [Aigarchaeota archaeon]|nr:TlpA family protein disulfide reductase [Aigarchaeota archaeon]
MELKGRALAALAALTVASVAAVAYVILTGVPGGDGSYNEPYLVVLWDDFDLASYSGRVILVDVGATWCGPCAIEVEELKTVRDEFSENELAIISIFYDPRDNPHTVAEYAREHRITWDVVYGRGAFEVFPVQLYPTLFILDKNLNLAFRRVGVASSPDTIKDVLSLLEQQSN